LCQDGDAANKEEREFHQRGTEFAEFGEFLNQELFTPRPPRLGGAIFEPCFTRKPEDPQIAPIGKDYLRDAIANLQAGAYLVSIGAVNDRRRTNVTVSSQAGTIIC
jgi:hypothetical protein